MAGYLPGAIHPRSPPVSRLLHSLTISATSANDLPELIVSIAVRAISSELTRMCETRTRDACSVAAGTISPKALESVAAHTANRSIGIVFDRDEITGGEAVTQRRKTKRKFKYTQT